MEGGNRNWQSGNRGCNTARKRKARMITRKIGGFCDDRTLGMERERQKRKKAQILRQ